jgi:hypothetical protein
VYLKVGILQVFLQLARQIYRCMLQFGDLHPRVVFVLPSDTEVLYHKISLPRKLAIDVQGPLGIRFGVFKEVACRSG